MQGFLDLINEWNFALGQALENHLATGSLVAVFVVFGAGLLTSLTPCVYPVIPVTVSYIGGAAAGNRRRAVSMSLVYVAGLSLVYTVLGVGAALMGKTFGLLSQNPWVMGGVGLLIVLFGLGMMNLFVVPVPSFLTGVQIKGVRKGGHIGAFLLGAAAAFITAPCSAPVVGVLLVAVGRTGNVVWASFLMLVFALGLSMLLLVLGIFSGTLSSLPKPGAWMNWVKNGFGIVMIVIGAWFILKAFL